MLIIISTRAKKDVRRIPRNVAVKFQAWLTVVRESGLKSAQQMSTFRDHALVGDRKGQRSVYLSRSWRLVYRTYPEKQVTVVEVLEVMNHEY